jgi:4-amino-4-deoxychorismate lyase
VTTRVLVNGAADDAVAVNDRGFQYGDGLFETVAVRDGMPLLWSRHLARLHRGAERLGLALPDAAVLTREAHALCHGLARAVLKLVISRGPGARGYRLPASPQPTRVLSVVDGPVTLDATDTATVRLCATRLSLQPALAGVKHLNRLEQVLARAEWGDDYSEGLMSDTAGNIIEGTASNVFLVADGVLCTPDVSQCGVAGVVRELVLERAPALGIRCLVQPITLDLLYRADEMFLTNSLIGVRPVTRLEQRTYAIGQITEDIRQTLKQIDAIV